MNASKADLCLQMWMGLVSFLGYLLMSLYKGREEHKIMMNAIVDALKDENVEIRSGLAEAEEQYEKEIAKHKRELQAARDQREKDKIVIENLRKPENPNAVAMLYSMAKAVAGNNHNSRITQKKARNIVKQLEVDDNYQKMIDDIESRPTKWVPWEYENELDQANSTIATLKAEIKRQRDSHKRRVEKMEQEHAVKVADLEEDVARSDDNVEVYSPEHERFVADLLKRIEKEESLRWKASSELEQTKDALVDANINLARIRRENAENVVAVEALTAMKVKSDDEYVSLL